MNLFTVEALKWQKNEFGYFCINAIVKYKIYKDLHLPPHNLEKRYAVVFDGKPHFRTDEVDKAFNFAKDHYINYLAKHGIKRYEKSENKESSHKATADEPKGDI